MKIDPTRYRELVFCGYGEPSERIDDCVTVVKRIRKIYPSLRIRINTNGHGDLIKGENTALLYKDIFDTVSISLNTSDPDKYIQMCRPVYGKEGYFAMIEFAKNVKIALNTPFVLYNGNKMVKKVYAIGGDGKDLIENAINCGADTIITGRASYNTTIDANDMGLNIVEAGHFYTENPVCKLIEKDVLSICPFLKTEIFNSNSIKAI
jgi:hypothetical protein